MAKTKDYIFNSTNFEQGELDTSTGAKQPDSYSRHNARVRSKDFVPVMSGRKLNVSGSFPQYWWLFEYDQNKNYLKYGSRTTTLDYRTAYIKITCASAESYGGTGTITPSNLAGGKLTMTEREIEYGKLSNDDLYTEGRNLLTRTENCEVSGTGTKASDTSYGLVPGLYKLMPGQKVTVSAQFDCDNLVFNDSGTRRLLVEPYVQFSEGASSYLGVAITNGDSASVLQNFHGRRYKTFTIEDVPITNMGACQLFIQGVESGTAKVSKPMMTLGEKEYPYTPAPEDFVNRVCDEYDRSV